MTINTCALWGTTSYVNSWLSINILIIICSLLAVALAYSLSGFLPASARSKTRGFVRFEMIQMIISIAIIAALLAFSAGACAISTSISQSLAGTTMGPFQYADYYVGAVSLGTGLNLLSNIYATSVSYSVAATVVRTLPAAFLRFGGKNFLTSSTGGTSFWDYLLSRTTPTLGGLCSPKTFCQYERIPSLDLAQLYTVFAQLYLSVYSPIILIAVGLLFIQFLALPIMQYTAFTIILPVAIAMRSVSFFGSSLGDASNAMIAIAIAFYIIYPMTVAFDSYAIAYVFSASNPSAQYAGGAFTVNAIKPFAYFQSQPPTSTGFGTGAELVGNQIKNFLCGSTASGASACLGAYDIVGTTHTYTDEMAQFIFEAILLFALNISITTGLAISIYKALKSGLGEAGRFW